MMRKDNLLSALLGQAALLLMAATALVVTSCTQDNDEPGNTLPEGKITLVPTVAPVTAWSTADGAADNRSAAPGTRADAPVPAALTGGMIGIEISTLGTDGNSAGTKIGCNYYSVSADGKLTRLPYDSGNLDETEADLAVDAPGDYWIYSGGTVTLTTDGIEYSGSFVRNEGVKKTITTDGKFSIALSIRTGGLRLNVKNTDGTDYTGTDVTAKPLTIIPYQYGTSFEVKTLTSTVHSAIWGNIYSSSSVNAGDPLLELATGGKTYRVLAPRQISFTTARLYTFNVRVGATGITVSSDDLGIADFDVQANTDVEAKPKPAPIVSGNNVWDVNGYWVTAPDADVNKTYQWAASDAANVMDSDPCAGNGNWRMPTMKDFEKMAGWTTGNSWSQDGASTSDTAVTSDKDTWNAAFPYGNYWSSVARTSSSNAWTMTSNGNGTARYSWYSKTNTFKVRCVQVQ